MKQLLLLIVLYSVACHRLPQPPFVHAEEYLHYNESELRERISTWPDKKKLDFYIYSSHAELPPRYAITEITASAGCPFVPVVIAEFERNESERMTLLVLLRHIDLYFCDISDNLNAKSLVQDFAETMENEETRRWIDSCISDINFK